MEELSETYFQWLVSDLFDRLNEMHRYEGVLRLLHEIPFYWTIWSDENRSGDALTFRQYEFLNFHVEETEHLDQIALGHWATAAPSVLEVLVGMAHRWSYYFEGRVGLYFATMFINMGFDRYPGKRLSTTSSDAIRLKVDNWLSRQFQPNGVGSPFPIDGMIPGTDMRKVDIWGQMNAYSAQHFQ